MTPFTILPVKAPVKDTAFDLVSTLEDALQANAQTLHAGDILAISSKYTAISLGRVVELADVKVSGEASALAERYTMNPQMVQLILQEADHIFGGIRYEFNGVRTGFLLTHKDGIISPNAGLDRSNIPSGKVVLFPEAPYKVAYDLSQQVRRAFGVEVGIILTDSWLVPGRWGTTGVALASAGFRPLQDERGKNDLFGNPMQVTQRGIADSLCVCAQMVMGERDEAVPFAILRNSGVPVLDIENGVEDVAIPWQMCIYVESLTVGALEQKVIK